MNRRIFKWSVFTGVAALAINSLHKNKWEISSLGLIRFGRAAVTVCGFFSLYI